MGQCIGLLFSSLAKAKAKASRPGEQGDVIVVLAAAEVGRVCEASGVHVLVSFGRMGICSDTCCGQLGGGGGEARTGIGCELLRPWQWASARTRTTRRRANSMSAHSGGGSECLFSSPCRALLCWALLSRRASKFDSTPRSAKETASRGSDTLAGKQTNERDNYLETSRELASKRASERVGELCCSSL